jgi:hypothetical protein
MINQTLSEKKLLIGALIIISTYMLVIYHGFENSCVLIHDNLDAPNYALLSKAKGSYFSLNGIIENVQNGIPSSSVFTGFSLGEILYLLFDFMVAYILNEIIIRVVAFLGMFLLLKKHVVPNKKEPSAIPVGVALCFAMLHFWPLGLSIAGQPLLLYAFLNIIKKESVWYDWLIIVLFPFYSSLFLAGFAICSMLLVILMFNSLRNREINYHGLIALTVLSLLYLVANYKLMYIFFFGSSFVSHRVEFYSDPLTIKEALIRSVSNFLNGQYHAASLHKYFISFSILVGFFCLYKQKKTNNLLIIIIIAAGLISLFYGFSGYIKPYLPDVTLIKTFQWNRIHYLHPLLWYTAFGIALTIIWRNSGQHKFTLYLVSFLLIFQIGCNVFNTPPVQMSLVNYLRQNTLANHLREKLMHRNYPISKQPTFKEFASYSLFNDIKRHINKPLDSYRVVSIGIHPSIALFNGFYVLDAYLTNYSLGYKHKFRKIIEKELSKNKKLREYYDDWGSRCYVFVSELGTNYLVQKGDNIKIRNLELNTAAFKKLGGEYILSAAEIMNYRKNHLVFLKEFENDASPWKIYLYEVDL